VQPNTRESPASKSPYEGANLSGKVFRNDVLDDESFQNANLRSADFRGAHLRSVVFDGAILGRTWHFLFLHCLTVFAICMAITYLVVFGAGLITQGRLAALPEGELPMMLYVSIVMAILPIMYFGKETFDKRVPSIVAASGVMIASGIPGAFSVWRAMNLLGTGHRSGTGLLALYIGAIFASTAVSPRSVELVLIVGFAVIFGAFAASLSECVFALVVAFAACLWLIRYPPEVGLGAVKTIRRLGILFSTWGATHFGGAICTGASFRNMSVANTNFTTADLTLVKWRGAEGISKARFSDSRMYEHEIQRLLSAGKCEERRFKRADLHGLYLAGADLRRVDLTEAVCTGTDFSTAKMTGACLENWNIDGKTILKDVHCEYVYLRQNDEERRPPEPNCFAPGEFEALFQQVIAAVVVVLRKDRDPQMIRKAFRAFRKKFPNVRFTKLEDAGDYIRIAVKPPPDESASFVERTFREMLQKLPQANDKGTIIIGNLSMISGTVNQPHLEQTSGDSRTTLVSGAGMDLTKVAEFLLSMIHVLPKLALDTDIELSIHAKLDAIQSQLDEQTPNKTSISEGLHSIRNILEGCAGSLLATGVAPALDTLMSSLKTLI
jgi:uncharacterized protein YjbI with pentapeptide repeats